MTIAVEGPQDYEVVRGILHAANFDAKVNVSIHIAGGKDKVRAWCKRVVNDDANIYAALVDADILSVSDSRDLAEEQLGHPQISVYCAVPTIEAWLFADDVVATKFARNAHASQILSRLPLPEMIPYPKQVAFNVFSESLDNRRPRKFREYSFLSEIDVERAMARSPSLKNFLWGLAQEIGFPFEEPSATLSKSIPRDIFANLLRELPGGTVVWKTLDRGNITAEELANAVVEGDVIGKQYVTEVLRLARDIIARRSSDQ
ncbi:hypothetical protein ACCS54_07265 [Rhizobium johnstonii]|uniref:hypothetical protein n=1 Tax=Rhizobium johnstonii TaxID=3019933 RepID=UPI003F970C38